MEYRVITYLYPLKRNFEIGNRVIDLTARANDWPDQNGEVIGIDGSMWCW